MTNNNYKNYLEEINATIIENNNKINELQRTNIALINMVEIMKTSLVSLSDEFIPRHEEKEMVKFEFKFGNNVVTRLMYEVDEMDFKKIPNIIMSCLNNGGGIIDINKIGSIEIEYFDYDGKGAILVNHDTEDLIRAYGSFMHIAEM